MLIEYTLTGGKLKIGKKELMLELLRNDSILRKLLGYSAGELKNLAKEPMAGAGGDGGLVTLDFSGLPERKLDGVPLEMLTELKKRYGMAIGGKLYFKSRYVTFGQINYSEIDLDHEQVMQQMDGASM